MRGTPDHDGIVKNLQQYIHAVAVVNQFAADFISHLVLNPKYTRRGQFSCQSDHLKLECWNDPVKHYSTQTFTIRIFYNQPWDGVRVTWINSNQYSGSSKAALKRQKVFDSTTPFSETHKLLATL